MANIPIGPNTSLNLSNGAAGLSHQQTLLNTNTHNLTGSGFVSQQLHKPGLTTVGAGAQYTHVPTGSGVNLGVQHTNKGLGTTGSVGANVNLYKDKSTSVNAYAQCSKHLSSKAKGQCTGGLTFTKHF